MGLFYIQGGTRMNVSFIFDRSLGLIANAEDKPETKPAALAWLVLALNYAQRNNEYFLVFALKSHIACVEGEILPRRNT